MLPNSPQPSDNRRQNVGPDDEDLSHRQVSRAFAVRRVAGPLWRWKLLPPAPELTGVALTKGAAKAAAREALHDVEGSPSMALGEIPMDAEGDVPGPH